MFKDHGIWRGAILFALAVLLTPLAAECPQATPTVILASPQPATQVYQTPMSSATFTVSTASPTPVPPEPSKTPEPSPTTEPVDLTIPADLQVNLTEEQIKKLNSVTEEKRRLTSLKIIPNAEMTQDAFIKAMGTTDPDLIALYKQFFNGETKKGGTNFSGLGFYYNSGGESGDAQGPGRGVGILYGVLHNSQIPENVRQFAQDQGLVAQPLWVVLQVRPGNNLTPDKNPDAFVVIQVGLRDQKGRVNATGMSVGVVKNNVLITKKVQKTDIRDIDLCGGLTDLWSVVQMHETFQLRRGTPIYTAFNSEAAVDRFVCSGFCIIMQDFPSTELQKAYSFLLK